MSQKLVFDVVSQPLQIVTFQGIQVVSANRIQDPIAIHDSVGFPAGAQQSVTTIRAGYAFRTQLLPATAQALTDALLAGLGTSWLLDWTQPEDMSASEEAALLAMLLGFPDDYFGSIQVTITAGIAGGYPSALWLCNQNTDRPSYQFSVANGSPDVFDLIEPGTYDAYAQDGSTGFWSVAQVVVITIATQPVLVFNAFSVVNPAAPCSL